MRTEDGTDFLQYMSGAEAGTAMTEFVAMIPIFITIFIAIIEMGAIARQAPTVVAESSKAMFEGRTNSKGFNDIQDQGRDAGILSALQTLDTHDTPANASADALNQLRQNPPKHGSRVTRVAIEMLETNAYAAGQSSFGGNLSSAGGMARAGLWGESTGRLAPIGTAGDWAYIMGAEEAVTGDPGKMFGRSTAGFDGSLLAESLMYTGYRPKQATQLGCPGAGVFGLSTAGVRPPLAAGVTYGTVTGEVDQTRDVAGYSVELNDYYTATVPPRGYPEGNGTAVFMSRLAFENCSQYPAYQDLLGIGGGQLNSNQIIQVPTAKEAGFTSPYNYVAADL